MAKYENDNITHRRTRGNRIHDLSRVVLSGYGY